jgi:hypothetical protein
MSLDPKFILYSNANSQKSTYLSEEGRIKLLGENVRSYIHYLRVGKIS